MKRSLRHKLPDPKALVLFPEPKPKKPKKPPVIREPATTEQIRLIALLGCCRFLPGSYDKRFVRDMQGSTELSEKQAAFLKKLGYKYRKQISNF